MYLINQVWGPYGENISPTSWLYKKYLGPIFSQYGPEQAWLIRDVLHYWKCFGKKAPSRTGKTLQNLKASLIERLLGVYSSEKDEKESWKNAKRIFYVKASSFRNVSHKTTTLVPEAFIYSLQRNFAKQTAFIIFVIGMKRWERWKPLVETVENLTFMPSAFDRRFWLEDIFNCSTSDMIGSVNKL